MSYDRLHNVVLGHNSDKVWKQVDYRWDTLLRRVYKLNPLKWLPEQVRNNENPIDIMIDMGCDAKDWHALSQYGSYCMDVLYTEALMRIGHAKNVKG